MPSLVPANARGKQETKWSVVEQVSWPDDAREQLMNMAVECKADVFFR